VTKKPSKVKLLPSFSNISSKDPVNDKNKSNDNDKDKDRGKEIGSALKSLKIKEPIKTRESRDPIPHSPSAGTIQAGFFLEVAESGVLVSVSEAVSGADLGSLLDPTVDGDTITTNIGKS
jgi:hypothetical protein